MYYIPYCAFKENGTDGWHSSLRGYLVLNDTIDFRTFTDREIARIEDNKLYYPFVAQGLIVHAFLVLQPYLMVHMVQELIRQQLMTEAEVPPKFFDIPTEEELNEHIHPREVTKLKLLIDWFLDKADKFFKVSWYVYKKQILSRIRNWNYDILRFYPIHEVPEDAIEGEVVKQFLQQEPEVVKMCLYIAHPPHDKSWVTWREEVLRPPIGTEPNYSEMLEELEALGVIEEIKEAMLKRRYELFFEIQEYIMKCKWVKLGFPVLRVLHGKFDDFVAASLLVAQPELMALCLSFVHLNFVPYPEVLVGFTEETPFSTDVLQGVLKLLEMIHDDEWSLKDSILNRLKSQKPLLECLLNVSLGYLRAPSSVRKAMLKVEDHDPQVIREILCAIELLELGPREFQSASQASSSGHSSVLGTNISSPEAPETRSPAMRRRVVSDMGPVSHVASGLRSQVSRRQGIVSESESPDSGYSGAGSPLQRSLGMESLSPGTSNTASLSPGMFTPGQTSSQAFSPVKLRRPRPQTSEATSPIASGSSPDGDSATPMTNPSSDPYVTASGVRLRRKPGRGNTQNTSQLVSSGSSGEHPNCHQQ